jgi:hypothetical protein
MTAATEAWGDFTFLLTTLVGVSVTCSFTFYLLFYLSFYLLQVGI